jgi:N-acetylmuramoyl-L-alanine amidase
MSSPMKYSSSDPAMKGLKYILVLKDNGMYKFYYSTTNFASIRDNNLKTAKDAGFRNATAISFVPNQKLASGYYTIEVMVTDKKLSSNSPLLNSVKDINREKENGVFYYTYGRFSSLEDAVKAQKQIEGNGLKNTVIQKILK